MKKLIFALFMVSMPHIALAESAWVLWQNTEIEDHYFWKILDAYPLYKDCQNSREKVWKAQEKLWKSEDTIAFPFTVMRRDKEGLHTADKYLCLPDTVNPNLFERRRD